MVVQKTSDQNCRRPRIGQTEAIPFKTPPPWAQSTPAKMLKIEYIENTCKSCAQLETIKRNNELGGDDGEGAQLDKEMEINELKGDDGEGAEH